MHRAENLVQPLMYEMYESKPGLSSKSRHVSLGHQGLYLELVIILYGVAVTYLKGAVGNARASVAFLTSIKSKLEISI